ncbi:MAG: hypothetical protein WBA74_21145, partial [Cyclobacteriaceae bacterium]
HPPVVTPTGLTTTNFYGNRYSLKKGRYKLRAGTRYEPIRVKLVYDQEVPVKYEKFPGIRIRDIETYDPISGQTTHRLFEYTEGTGNDKQSSGKVFTIPDFGGYFTEAFYDA